MKHFQGGTAVITGAASGFGLEVSRLAARLGMNIVMADIQPDALATAVAEITATGAQVLAHLVDVSKAVEVDRLGLATFERFGAPTFVFNNAGVSGSGLIWESTAKDWDWVLGVNLMGVVHGVRVFTPMMLQAARQDSAYRGHIVNAASVAGLVAAPNMGVYTVSKHAVVALSETLYHDLRLVTGQVNASVLCPSYVPTGIARSTRNRPPELSDLTAQTRSQRIGRAMASKAVSGGTGTAAAVAKSVFEAIREERFYIHTHADALAAVQTRFDDVVNGRNPGDPFADLPQLGADLRKALCADLLASRGAE